MSDCIFCRIIAGEIPSDTVYEDEKVIAFRDINPMAPVHILIIPKQHIASLQEIAETHTGIIGHMTRVAHKLAIKTDIADTGYRLVINNGPMSGQMVQHLHMHLLGGKMMDGQLG